ncbi:hypothetical protein H6F41_12630 [Pseudanabaena sp. FACHB-723]|uniref:Uncharacterized protein n=2 Tax=Pseudanabaena mucicola TaxID=71190 RepID=A0ABR8A0C2_9CYAN|nr:hypothetical protein [Pseudanabaena mucicola FACHB-723]
MNPEEKNTPISQPLETNKISNLPDVEINRDYIRTNKNIEGVSLKDITPTQGEEVDIPARQETTRSWLATFLTYTLAGTIAASFCLIISLIIMSGFIVDEKKNSSFDKTSTLAKDLITFILTAQTGLIGTALGFYFGSRGNAD